MDKPFSIALRETERQIIDVLNASGLPADVAVMVLGNITEMAAEQAKAQYRRDLAEYEKAKETNDGYTQMDDIPADADDRPDGA